MQCPGLSGGIVPRLSRRGGYTEAHPQPLPGADRHQTAPAGAHQPKLGVSEGLWCGGGHGGCRQLLPEPLGYTRLLVGRRDNNRW